MARNKIVHLNDLDLVEHSRSKYILHKSEYINKKYNRLHLSDIVCDRRGFVYGVCSCECGNTDLVTGIYALISGKTKECVECARLSGSRHTSKYDSDEYIGKIYGHLKVLEYYHGSNENGKGVFWKTKCLICGNIKDFKASLLVNGTTISCGCLLNNRNNKYSDDSWVNKDIAGTKILNILEKSEEGQMWMCQCKYCGKPFKVLARKIVSRHTNSCGCINDSMGVIEITKYLSSNNVMYIREWSHNTLLSQYGYKLRYDFAIVDSKNNVIGLVEYDGNQHNDPGAGFGKYSERISNFNDIADSDMRKNDFAKNHNIPLLRIKYSRRSEEVISELKSFIDKLKIH